MNRLQKIGFAGTVLVASGVMGVGIGLASGVDDADMTPEKRSGDAPPTPGEDPLGAALENTPEWQAFVEENPEFGPYAEALRDGREGIFSPTGELGWIDTAVATSTEKADGPEDLAPIKNEAGERIAWYAHGYGWVGDEDLASGGFEGAIADLGPKMVECDENGENCELTTTE